MAFQKETITDFSEVRKCPQVPLEQMKLCMTSSLLGLISDLWTGNNKDPDVMEAHETGKTKREKKKMNPAMTDIRCCRSARKWKFLSLTFTHAHAHNRTQTVKSVSHWYSLTRGWKMGITVFI